MILNGLLPTRIQQIGCTLFKVTIAILAYTLFLSGCSFEWWIGDGRGDWTLDVYNGYAISKINSNEILFVRKENPEDSGGEIVLSNYFVTAYQLHEPYICLKGIHTQEMSAVEEELNKQTVNYYLIDTTDGKIAGPFESYNDFKECYSFLGLEMNNEWIKLNQ